MDSHEDFEEAARKLFDEAESLADKERFEDAIALYTRAGELFEKTGNKNELGECNYNKGHCLEILGCHEEAITSYDIAAELYIDSEDRAVCHYKKGLTFEELQFYEEAITSYDIAAGFFSNDDDKAKCYLCKGAALAELQRYAETIDLYDSTADIDIDDDSKALCFFNKGYSLFELQRYNEAIASFDIAAGFCLENDHKARCFFNKGRALYELQCYEEAIASFDIGADIDLDGDYKADFLFNKGRALHELQRYEDAINSHDIAAHIYSDNYDKAVCFFNKGSALCGLQRYEEAIASFDIGAEFYSDDKNKADCHFYKGLSYFNLDKPEESRLAYKKAYELYGSAADQRATEGITNIVNEMKCRAMQAKAMLRAKIGSILEVSALLDDPVKKLEQLKDNKLAASAYHSMGKILLDDTSLKGKGLEFLHKAINRCLDCIDGLPEDCTENDVAKELAPHLETWRLAVKEHLERNEPAVALIISDHVRSMYIQKKQPGARVYFTKALEEKDSSEAMRDLRATIFEKMPPEIAAISFFPLGGKSVCVFFIHAREVRTEIIESDIFLESLSMSQNDEKKRIEKIMTMLDSFASVAVPKITTLVPDSVKNLIFIPYGILHILPLGAMKMGKGHVLDRFVTSYAPSLSILKRCLSYDKKPDREKNESAETWDFTAMFPGNAYDPVMARPEAEYLTSFFSGSGRKGKIERIVSTDSFEKARSRVLHYSGHSSTIGIHTGKDSIIPREDIEKNCDFTWAWLVYLSSCQSSLIRPGHTDEFNTLSSVFLIKGARAVAGTLWNTNDFIAMVFSSRFYANLKSGMDYAKAMQEAQIWMKNPSNEKDHRAKANEILNDGGVKSMLNMAGKKESYCRGLESLPGNQKNRSESEALTLEKRLFNYVDHGGFTQDILEFSSWAQFTLSGVWNEGLPAEFFRKETNRSFFSRLFGRKQ
ncbi:CHAT domain-containing tetratricopeptide repeat protein [Desulforegula conservatrix]|uniref:CHAT domain-containing tetratricopeptide repeat protein n=1 Tax=Desulforegula conservatrix TaxID=153026 RepID=UPI0003F77713|nr:CHAT domain-containing tetratricopeptide repeat protein [Desulforegula conservatrix]